MLSAISSPAERPRPEGVKHPDASTVEYLSFEGGGGKGLAYLGAIRYLETPEMGLLPMNTGRVKGLAGASAGAITSFFLSVGMTAKDIQQRISNNDFAQFWDEPMPGLYKAVKFDGTRNVPGYTSDSITSHMSAGDKPQLVLDRMTSGSNFYADLATAKTEGAKNQDLLERGFGFLRVMKLAGNLLNVGKRLNGSGDALMTTLVKGPDGKPSDKKVYDYFYSELMDRGLFSGEGIRKYLRIAMAEGLTKNFFVPMQLAGIPPDLFNADKAGLLTFAELYKITGRDFIVSSTNITTERPMLFSWKWTPDFPVVEAVCMSMSIPGVFKPTFVNAVVNKAYAANHPENVKYKGFYVDGGTLNNLPIHAWDIAPDQPMNPAVLGIRVTGGIDKQDETYDKDPLWIKYTDTKNAQLQQEGKPKVPYKRMIKSEVQYDGFGMLTVESDLKIFLSPLGGYAGDILGTLMYPAEEGQIRTPEEAAKTIEFFSYEIGVLDFTPDADLRTFVQQRAEDKMRAYFEK